MARRAVKDVIEALGVPHTEIDLIVVDVRLGRLGVEPEFIDTPATFDCGASFS